MKLADVELYGVKSLLFCLEVGVACKAKVRKTQEALHVELARILMIDIIGVLPKIAGKQWNFAVSDRRVCILRRDDF